MAKIAQASAKYIIYADISIDGVVDRPDVIGAIFGQTEGLLGSDLELRELQRSGRIGRIEVISDSKNGKTKGEIQIPSSLDKAETAIIASSLEVIERIGPCDSKIKVTKIDDVRISKRKMVIDRAKELLKELISNHMPESQTMSDEVAQSVRVMEINEFGRDKLPAGPTVKESEEVIVVEGRADVVNLLKFGIKNVIAMNGSKIPKTIIELSKHKIITVFIDGDRGGDLNVLQLFQVAEIDYVTKAPDGKEVEELTQKEILKALRSKITAEQAKLELGKDRDKPLRSVKFEKRSEKSDKNSRTSNNNKRPSDSRNNGNNKRSYSREERRSEDRDRRRSARQDELETFKDKLKEIENTKGAFILDKRLEVMGKVSIDELSQTVKALGNDVYAVVLDGNLDQNLIDSFEKSNVSFAVLNESNAKSNRVRIITNEDLQ